MDYKKDANTVILLSATSDIGTALAKRYSADGYNVIGTYRSLEGAEKLREINMRLYFCDLDDTKSISDFINDFKNTELEWETFISCPSNPLPVKPFFKCDFEEWQKSVHTNAIEQLRVLHGLYPYRDKSPDKESNVVFFATAGINSPAINISAYTASKLFLLKMCEYLDAENPDLNPFIVGPGWTRTKTHDLILNNLDSSDPRYNQTKEFLASNGGTSMDDIYDCIQWLCSQGKKVVGGRNFSVVYDPWKLAPKCLAQALIKDPDMYKVRRQGNMFNHLQNIKRKNVE